MSEFLQELFTNTPKIEPDKVSAKDISCRIETKIESTKFVDGEKVKTETDIKTEKAVIETKHVTGSKTMYLSYDCGATLNLGSFNMGKTNVSLSMPVGVEITPEILKKLDDSFSFLKGYVESKMKQEVKELLGLRGKL